MRPIFNPKSDADALAKCLARLLDEVATLEQLGATVPAAKTSEACDALERAIAARRGA